MANCAGAPYHPNSSDASHRPDPRASTCVGYADSWTSATSRDSMMGAKLLNRSIVVRELMPQDLKLGIDPLTREEAVDSARNLAKVIRKDDPSPVLLVRQCGTIYFDLGKLYRTSAFSTRIRRRSALLGAHSESRSNNSALSRFAAHTTRCGAALT